MAYPVYTIEDLSSYSGRPQSAYTSYADTALAQATLLFKIGTCLADFPTEEPDASLAQYAILALADSIFLNQPYQQALATPFSSESIGSYSYTKSAASVAMGAKTGVGWFDLAIDRLSVCDQLDDIPSGGGIEMFEHDGVFVQGQHVGNARFLSPQDVHTSRLYGYDPAPGYDPNIYPAGYPYPEE